MAEAVPETMRAAVLRQGVQRLEVVVIPTPVPRRGEALVRVTACGVCHTDLHVMRGDVAFPRPAVLGHEISGRIVALGPGVRNAGLLIGDDVVAGFIMPCTTCDACLAGRDDLCESFFARNRLRGTLYDGESRLRMPDGGFLAMYSMGGLAEYAVVPLSALTRLPLGVDPEAACVLGCAGLTSFAATYRAGRVKKGDAVAIVGVGGIGSSLIPMLLGAGAKTVVAVDIADEKLARARELGATHLVDARDHDTAGRVRAATGGGASVVFEAIGSPETFRSAMQMLADGGRLVAIGIAPSGATAEVEITPLVRRGYEIVGSFGGRTRIDLPRVANLAAAGHFDPASLITRRYPLADVDSAYADLAAGRITGRAIVVFGSYG